MVREKATEWPQYKLQTNSFEKSTGMAKNAELFEKDYVGMCANLHEM